jgi:hypothetical protein
MVDDLPPAAIAVVAELGLELEGWARSRASVSRSAATARNARHPSVTTELAAPDCGDHRPFSACVGVFQSSFNDLANVDLWDCNDTFTQRWTFLSPLA